MKVFTVCTKEPGKNDKTYWPEVGKLFVPDDMAALASKDNNIGIKLNMFPDLKLYAFPPKPRDQDDNPW